MHPLEPNNIPYPGMETPLWAFNVLFVVMFVMAYAVPEILWKAFCRIRGINANIRKW
jgi:hypothetical protein